MTTSIQSIVQSLQEHPGYLRLQEEAEAATDGWWKMDRRAISAGNRRFYVWDRDLAESSAPAEPHAVVSITDPVYEPANLPDVSHRRGLLRLEFHDIHDFEMPDHFSEEHAEQILAFAREFWSPDTALLVHCEAGISRSAGVAAGLVRAFGESPKAVFSGFQPNPLVYARLVCAAGLTIGDEFV